MGTEWENLGWEIEDITQYPLKLNAIAGLNWERKAGVSDKQLANRVTFLWEHNALGMIKPAEGRALVW